MENDLYARNEPVEHGVRIHFEFSCYGYIDAVEFISSIGVLLYRQEFPMQGITLCGCKAEPKSYRLNDTYVVSEFKKCSQLSF